MNDLLYFGRNEKQMRLVHDLLVAQFPEGKLEFDWDEIHQHRLSVTLPEKDEVDYFALLLHLQLIMKSLKAGMILFSSDGGHECDAWKARAEELKEEKRNEP